MCSGSEAGSYLRLIDFVYHSTLGLRVIKKKKKVHVLPQRERRGVFLFKLMGFLSCGPRQGRSIVVPFFKQPSQQCGVRQVKHIFLKHIVLKHTFWEAYFSFNRWQRILLHNALILPVRQICVVSFIARKRNTHRFPRMKVSRTRDFRRAPWQHPISYRNTYNL